jgi:hypothetical protein
MSKKRRGMTWRKDHNLILATVGMTSHQLFKKPKVPEGKMY